MRATPKTSSPVQIITMSVFLRCNDTLCDGVGELTFSDLWTEGDVLLRRALDLLFGRHVCGGAVMSEGSSKIDVAASKLMVGGRRHEKGAKPDWSVRLQNFDFQIRDSNDLVLLHDTFDQLGRLFVTFSK